MGWTIKTVGLFLVRLVLLEQQEPREPRARQGRLVDPLDLQASQMMAKTAGLGLLDRPDPVVVEGQRLVPAVKRASQERRRRAISISRMTDSGSNAIQAQHGCRGDRCIR